MAEEEYDPYALDEGTVLGEGTVTITAASFGYDAQYGNGEIALAILEGSVVTADNDTFEWRKLYSIGKGWEVLESGAKVGRADGKVRNFQKQSKYGLWIAGALAAGAGQVLRGRGTPQEAKIWNGLVFEVAAKETDYGGEIGKKSTLVPVKYVGEAGQTAQGTSGSASPVASAAPTPSAPTPAPTGISGALRAKLRKIALESDTHDGFIDRAFVEVEGVDGNKEVEAAVADSPALYNELRAG